MAEFCSLGSSAGTSPAIFLLALDWRDAGHEIVMAASDGAAGEAAVRKSRLNFVRARVTRCHLIDAKASFLCFADVLSSDRPSPVL